MNDIKIFKRQSRKLESSMKTELSRKWYYFSKSVQHLGIKIDENLN